LKELARQISELPDEDFSLLETATQLPSSISLPGLTTEAHLAAVVEKLKQEAYYSDSGAVSDFDGSVSEGARSRSNSLQCKEVNIDLRDEPDHVASTDPLAVTLAGQCVLASKSCKPHDSVGGDEARQVDKVVKTSDYPSTSAEQQTSLEDTASMKPNPSQRVEDSGCSSLLGKLDAIKKPSAVSNKHPTNQLKNQSINHPRTADSRALQKGQEKHSHWQKGSSNGTVTARNDVDSCHQNWYQGPQRRQPFPRKKRRTKSWRQSPDRLPHHEQPITHHVPQEQRSSLCLNSPSSTQSHSDSGDSRYQGSFNHLEVVQFLWQGEILCVEILRQVFVLLFLLKHTHND